jgi:hypothetical protein
MNSINNNHQSQTRQQITPGSTETTTTRAVRDSEDPTKDIPEEETDNPIDSEEPAIKPTSSKIVDSQQSHLIQEQD